MGFNWWRDGDADGPSVQEIVDRVQAEWRAERRRIEAADCKPGNMTMWPNGGPHEAPEQPLSVAEAHRTLQRHRACRADDCPRKAAAKHTLIAAGRMKPDTSREN